MITQPKFWIGQKVRVRTPEEIGSELWNEVYTKKACNGSPGTSYIITVIEYMRGDYYYKLGEASYHSRAVLDLASAGVNNHPRIPMEPLSGYLREEPCVLIISNYLTQVYNVG